MALWLGKLVYLLATAIVIRGFWDSLQQSQRRSEYLGNLAIGFGLAAVGVLLSRSSYIGLMPLVVLVTSAVYLVKRLEGSSQTIKAPDMSIPTCVVTGLIFALMTLQLGLNGTSGVAAVASAFGVQFSAAAFMLTMRQELSLRLVSQITATLAQRPLSIILFGTSAACVVIISAGYASIWFLAVYCFTALLVGGSLGEHWMQMNQAAIARLVVACIALAMQMFGVVLENAFMSGVGGLIFGFAIYPAWPAVRSTIAVLLDPVPAMGGFYEPKPDVVPLLDQADLVARAAELLSMAEHIVVVPGYGWVTAAGSEKALPELVKTVESGGTSVAYAVHPVAGRMPGHVHLLLDELGIGAEHVLDIEQANLKLTKADVALVIGANDIVNPEARDNKSSRLYGMMVINADQAKMSVIVTRGAGAGFSGVVNPLFSSPRSLMLKGDSNQVLHDIRAAIEAGRLAGPGSGK